MTEETSVFGMEQGCLVHGDEDMRECRLCGQEYCGLCSPTRMCPDCAEDLGDEDGGGPDFEDVEDMKSLGIDDDEADRVVESNDDLIPHEDLVDDEGQDEEAPPSRPAK
jgi:hypothetical protein